MNHIEQNKPELSEEVKEALFSLTRDNIYMRNLQIEIQEIKLGYVKGKMMVTEEIMNPYGSIHGGCLYSLADIVTGLAACTYGVFSSTINGSMEYIIPAMNTEYIICESVEIRQGKHVSLYEANIYDDKGRLVDKARFSFYMMNRSVVQSVSDSDPK